jgi:glyoxylase-like metal-dependent hydrolase (beta-lactamase superfamily II)
MPSLPEFRIVSIGTLAANPLWNEKSDVRTGHATTTLISVPEREMHILVDPSLPVQALIARMSERTSLKPAEITHVFLTNFQSERRRALRAFDHAQWFLHEPEQEAALAELTETREEAAAGGDPELARLATAEITLLQRCTVAPDALAPRIDLFPLPGVTPGNCGLLLALPRSTVLICGDAVATAEHLAQGKILPHCADLEQAQQSFSEAVEIADVLIPGRDNLIFNPMRSV